MKEDYTDNKEYRRDYKRWHTFKTRDQEYSAKRQRELDENSCLQSVLDAEPDQPRFKKPRGRAPLADGVPCTWDGERGYWVTASGAHHDVAALRKATTAEYFSAMKLPDAEVQEQRRSVCARVAATVEARLAPSASLLERLQKEKKEERLWRPVPPDAPADFYALAGAVRCHGAALADALPPSFGWCPPDEIQPTTVATVSCEEKHVGRFDNGWHMVEAPGAEAFSAKVAELAGETGGTKLGGWLVCPAASGALHPKLRVRRSALFWQQASALVAQEADLTWEQFEYHYRELTRSRLVQLLNEREREVKEWEQQEEEARRVEREAETDRLHGGREKRLKTEARRRAEEEARKPFERERELMRQKLDWREYTEWCREQKTWEVYGFKVKN